jgi:K+-sensing histidine kinase KdpD
VVIELLQSYVPVLTLGVLYVFAVLPVAVRWGSVASVAVAVASMLAFNFFFLAPLYTFTLAEPSNWFSLAVFLVTAIVVSELASRSRQRATESALLAEIAASLLQRGQVTEELDRIAEEVASVLEVGGVRIDLGGSTTPGGTTDAELIAGGRSVGVIHLEPPLRPDRGARRRLLPGLASLLGVALDRERLQSEALEAEALRRSDAMKTALLQDHFFTSDDGKSEPNHESIVSGWSALCTSPTDPMSCRSSADKTGRSSADPASPPTRGPTSPGCSTTMT